MFQRGRSILSRVVKIVLQAVHTRYGHLLEWDGQRLTGGRLDELAEAIRNVGAPFYRCVGFIDGTVRPICRPMRLQKQFYNGHRRVHALKFQSVVSPDGIIVHLSGPYIGRRHDARILRESNLIPLLIQNLARNDQPYYLYGDPAYQLQRHLMVPFGSGRITERQQLCNERMSKVRECVEWNFAKITSVFAFVDFKKQQKLYQYNVGLRYKVAAILTNCHTCYYGSQTSAYFRLAPPTIAEYLHLDVLNPEEHGVHFEQQE
jgi:hypothetical protein